MHRQIAGKLTSPRDQVDRGSLRPPHLLRPWPSSAPSSLDVQNNEASSWLPASAESTKALEKLAPFQDQNAIPTIVVYLRATAGLTEDDLAAIQAQVAEIQDMDGVEWRGRRPDPVRGRRGRPDGGHVQLRQERLERPARHRRRAARHRRDRRRHRLHRRSGRPGRRLAEAFAGIDSSLLLATLGVVILILLFTYRSPDPVDPADLLGRRRAGHRARGWSTSSPSTPTSPSTARARRS